MTPRTDEQVIQNNTIDLLKNMGYIYIAPEDMTKFRSSTRQVVLKDVLLKQLQKLNGFEYKGTAYKFSAKNIARAIDDLDVLLNEGLMTANQKISDQLLLGNSYSEELIDGVKKSFSLHYIDYKNPENNLFHVTEEFVVDRVNQQEQHKTRRPDLVLFINGIPFGVIELKRSSRGTEEGISQMLRNQSIDEIPTLFKYVQMTLAGNNHSPQYGTTGTPKKFYAVWKEKDVDLSAVVKDRTPSPLDKSVYALFEKHRMVELLHSFVIFDGKVKKIARYQQYFAIESIMERIGKLDNTGRRQGGLIWHTQGSGKSLTMVMLAKVIKRNIVGSKVIIVTDRKDLDKQIHDTFNNSEVKAVRAKSGRDLVALLQSGKSVITTLIHKFEKVKNENVTFNDPNTFILVDESHRTQGGDMHKAMKKVFPQACYLGFTGTPLMRREKNSFAKFGGEIHRYTINQAVEDKAVLPLLYEGRLVDQWVNDEKGLDRRFEQIVRHLNEEQVLDLKKKWARFQKVASSERRLEMIMLDINEDVRKRLQGTDFKAILATSSKYEAIKYHKLFEEMGDIRTAFVISAPDSREGHSEVDDENRAFIQEEWSHVMKKYGDEEQYLDKVKDEFINGEEIELLIVVDKLLTGFDAPRASVLYIDKLLKEHNLLQAIARVNRLYEGKDFGFIVDYRGLLGDLDKALNDYSGLADFDEEDITGAVFDIREEIARVKTYYEHLEELFKEVENKQDQESYEVCLADEEKRKRFYDCLSHYARALKLALSSDKMEEVFSAKEIVNYKEKMKFYAQLRKAVRIRYHEQVDFGKYEKQMQKLLDTFISADEVNQLTKLVNIFDEEFEKELERVVGDNARADSILSATTAVITEKRESNPAYYDKLSKRIQEIIEEYREKRLTEEEKLKHAKEIRDLLIKGETQEASSYPNEIGHSSHAKAFYDNLKEHFSEAMNNVDEHILVAEAPLEYGRRQEADLLTQMVLKIVDIFKNASKKPDWKNNRDMRNNIEGQIDDLFWEMEDEYGLKFANSDELLATIQQIGIKNYG
ncbi:MAG: type I restriction endonuclease subunit R [Sulfurovum sp.]|nr:type I restriction endonuclease subunit R [Sulfurovum sp.]